MGIYKEQISGLENKDENSPHDRDWNYEDMVSTREELRDMKK